MISRRTFFVQIWPVVLWSSVSGSPRSYRDFPIAARSTPDREDCSFLYDVRQDVLAAVRAGRMSATECRTVLCPLCNQQIGISASDVLSTRA